MELWVIWHPRYGYIDDAIVECKEEDGGQNR
jgi:hypothetical protein